MKRPLLLAAALLLCLSLAACRQKFPEQQVKAPVSSGIESAATESSSSLEVSQPVEEPALPENLLIQVRTAAGDVILFQLNDSTAASSLYRQLPLTVQIEDYAESEKIFDPPGRLDISNAPLAQGPAGTLAYYEPWGNIALFYADCNGASGLYELGKAVSGAELIPALSGEVRITAAEESAEPESKISSSTPPQEEKSAASVPSEQTNAISSAPKTTASVPPQEVKPSVPAPLPETTPVVPEEPKQPESSSQGEVHAMQTLQIHVESQSFAAILYDNDTTRALIKNLPLTITMSEMNGNEKYHYLSESLPTHASRPAGIRAGDLMLYGSDCLVLFYKSFSTSYNYTPLGRIDDPAGLSEALGTGDVQVSFQIAE